MREPVVTVAPVEVERFEWREVRRGIFDIQTWLTALAYMAVLISLYSYSLFLCVICGLVGDRGAWTDALPYSRCRPTIIQGLGYSGTRTQIFTVPPYIPAAFLTVIVAYLSDRYKRRMVFALVLLVPSIIGKLNLTVRSTTFLIWVLTGYIVAITAKTNSVRYGAVFLMAAGVYPVVPCILGEPNTDPTLLTWEQSLLISDSRCV